jgi:tRNA threonylcarbamoyl adenosine modification protein YeaZ
MSQDYRPVGAAGPSDRLSDAPVAPRATPPGGPVNVEYVLVLALDTATPAITAALVELDDLSAGSTAGGDANGGVRLLAERVTVNSRAHGELLAPQITAVLADAGGKARDLGAVVVGTGPGPFTGLRVGLVTAATMSFALDIPAYGVCTLDALGAAAAGAPGAAVLVATDARRKEIYWAVYRDGVRVTEPSVNRPADVTALLAEHDVLVGVGEGAASYAQILGVDVGELRYPPALELVRLAAGRIRAGAPSDPLTPLYLRRPDAVEPAARKPALAASER